jgi:hypothetical protein
LNTYIANGKIIDLSKWEKSGTALTTDPYFKDAANGDFAIASNSAQAKAEGGQTGDARWGTWEAGYAITVSKEIANGTVTVDKPYAAKDAEVTLTVTPAEGYELDAVSVTGVTSDIAVVVTDGKFTMPADAVTVNATFKSTTGINGVKADALKDAQIYNLQGVRVDKAQKGLYIVNGRKVVVK